MADYNVRFYEQNPDLILSTGIGSFFTWTGSNDAIGTATITDNEAGIQGTTLDDDSNGAETATANVTINGQTSTGTTVDAEITWTVRDTVTGEVFQVAQFDVETGNAAGFYTLSEVPLVSGRSYEVLEYNTNPDASAGDPVFSYTDYVAPNTLVTGTGGNDSIDAAYLGDPEGDQIDDGLGGGPAGQGNIVEGMGGDDTILAGAGDDIVYGGEGGDSVDGGDGADLIYGDTNGPSGSSASELLSWAAQAPDETNVFGGFTQNTGGMDVSVSVTNDDNNAPTFTIESTETVYTETGEPFGTQSSAVLTGSGNGPTATVTLDFAAATGSGLLDQVENLSFRLNDIDRGDESWRDVVTINAFDAQGNPVSVTLTPAGDEIISGNTITAGGDEEAGSNTPAQSAGSVLVEIAGPVSQIDIIYSNAGSGSQNLYIGDVAFDTIDPAPEADDNLSGGAGDDTILGEIGNDTIDGGAGSDQLSGGLGDDSILGGADDDTIYGGGGTDTLDGGDGADIIYGDTDSATGTATTEFLDWSLEGADEANLGAGFVQNTGSIDVTATFVDTGNNNASLTIEASDPIYTEAGEPYNPNVSGDIRGSGDGSTGTLTLDFAAAEPDTQDEVENVSFRIADLDWGGGNHRDVVTVNAYDADGNPVTVTLTPEGSDIVSGNTVTAASTNEQPSDAEGSVLVEIAGPVSQIEIIYVNGESSGGHNIQISDVYFDAMSTVAEPGDDSILGGAGTDLLYGEAGADIVDGGLGNDTLDGGEGNDSLTGGDGDDVFLISAGNDTISDFNFGNTGLLGDGDTTNNDFIDLSGYYDNLDALRADQQDDGILNQSNAFDTEGNATDYSDNTQFGTSSLTMQGATGSSYTVDNTGVVCFTEGTRILTPAGNVPIASLRVGDLVCTKDNGVQPLAWIGRRTLERQDLEDNVRLRPILIKKDVLGAERDLLVSRQHGMLIGEDHLVRAAHLVGRMPGVRIAHGKRRVTYIHLMFDAHQIVFAEGIPSESFFPGPMALNMMPPETKRSLELRFPGVRKIGSFESAVQCYGAPARPFAEKNAVCDLLEAARTACPPEASYPHCAQAGWQYPRARPQIGAALQ